jgi:hypothetical protein
MSREISRRSCHLLGDIICGMNVMNTVHQLYCQKPLVIAKQLGGRPSERFWAALVFLSREPLFFA